MPAQILPFPMRPGMGPIIGPRPLFPGMGMALPAQPALSGVGAVVPPPGPSPVPEMAQGAPSPVDPNLAATVTETYIPVIRMVRERRQSSKVEDEWIRNWDCWRAVHRRQGFKGEWFNHYVPAARKSLEKFVIRCKQMLFPSPEFFEVFPTVDSDEPLGQEAEAWRRYLLWLLTRRNKVRNIMGQVLRCYLLYQRGITKTVLKRGEDGWLWPTIRAVDPFMFYVWPETAPTIDDASVCIEHTMIPWPDYQDLVSRHEVIPISQENLTAPEWQTFYLERLGQSGFTPPSDYPMAGKPPQAANEPAAPENEKPTSIVHLVECWWKERGRWVQAWVVWNHKNGPIPVKTNARFPSTPYRMAIARQVPGEHYTSSMMSDLEPVNVLLNDQTNMTLEGEATALFPPTAVNPDLVARADSLVHRPRAKWLMDPNGAKVLESQANVNAGFQGMQAAFNMLDSFSGSNPLADGQPVRGMPRAGFAMSTLVSLGMADIRDVAEDIEDNILTPSLTDMARLTALLPQQQLQMIPGVQTLAPGLQMGGASYRVDYLFRWIGTLQSQDAQQRGQRLMAMSGQLAKIYPAMKAAGYEVRFNDFWKRLWRDGIGERGADSIVFKLPPQPPTPPQPPQPHINVSVKGEVDLATAFALATGNGAMVQGAPPQAGPPQGQGPGPITKVSSGPASPGPGTAEQGERMDARALSEGPGGSGGDLSGVQ